MTRCPHCGANAWYRAYHRGRQYLACMCGFEASRAAFDPAVNVHVAYLIWQDSGWAPWSCAAGLR